jgi:hypothetical protein
MHSLRNLKIGNKSCYTNATRTIWVTKNPIKSICKAVIVNNSR